MGLDRNKGEKHFLCAVRDYRGAKDLLDRMDRECDAFAERQRFLEKQLHDLRKDAVEGRHRFWTEMVEVLRPSLPEWFDPKKHHVELDSHRQAIYVCTCGGLDRQKMMSEDLVDAILSIFT